MPRWHILRTLLHKEVLRHLANRGGLVLLLLLVVASLLLSFLRGSSVTGGFTGGVQRCYVDYWEDGPLVQHLRRHVPAELAGNIRFRSAANVPTDAQGTIVYAQATGAIQLRPLPDDRAGFKVWFWHPGEDGTSFAPFEAWFWKETVAYFQQAQRDVPANRAEPYALLLPPIEAERSALKGGLDPRSGLATSLVLFGLFFVCVYLLPSLTCEERERGVLLAQALSPASAREILTAKFLFYPAFGLVLAAVLAGTFNPQVLVRPFFWLALLITIFGSMGIGLTIASVARTQRSASMGAMCYMLAVALLLFICQQNGIPGLPYLALEYHCPRMLHAVLTDSVQWYHWGHLGGATALAIAWAIGAAILFRRYGWQ
jgi:hypothetical protein